jgi:hypothetical protein
VLSNALRQVFAVALYRFTTSGGVAQGFDRADLESAIRVRGRRHDASPAVSWRPQVAPRWPAGG